MEEHENLYEKIREILGGEPGSLKVLEHQIDLDLQVEYYECSRKQCQEVDEEWAMDRARYLKEPGYSEQVKKDILARLATIVNVECYRTIEAFASDASGGIKDWALLALNESRMLLESQILNESQVFISTGLGGEDSMLRYFVVLLGRDSHILNDTQKRVIMNEFDDVLKNYGARAEKYSFNEELASLLVLLPMNYSLKQVFNEAISECNNYGNFLNDDFIVTNVKILSFEEIRDFLSKKEGKA